MRFVLFSLLICLALSGCNTVKGLGQDMTTAADSMCIYCH